MAQKALRRLAGHDGIDRGAGGPGRPQRRLARVRVQHRVGIDPDIARLRHRAEDPAGVAARMNALDLLERRLRRLAAGRAEDRGLVDRPQDRLQPDRRFGMARARIVLQGHRMRVEQQAPPPGDGIGAGGQLAVTCRAFLSFASPGVSPTLELAAPDLNKEDATASACRRSRRKRADISAGIHDDIPWDCGIALASPEASTGSEQPPNESVRAPRERQGQAAAPPLLDKPSGSGALARGDQGGR